MTSLRAEVAALQDVDQALTATREELQALKDRWEESMATSRNAHDALEVTRRTTFTLVRKRPGAYAFCMCCLWPRLAGLAEPAGQPAVAAGECAGAGRGPADGAQLVQEPRRVAVSGDEPPDPAWPQHRGH